VSAPTNDEGFREIQLNGKQLVFLFMAATVVSVVIFLCGVLVGRGVRSDRAPAQEVASAEIAADPGATRAPAAQASTPPAAEPPAPPDELTYAERLQRTTPPRETLKPAPPPVAESSSVEPAIRARQAPTPAQESAPVRTPQGVIAAKTGPAASAPTGPGFAVQVMIFPTRQEADTLAKRLVAKGYPAFVMDPVKGAPKVFYRVRVGKYRTRKDAEEMQARLEKNEQFTTAWIAR
jgi:DedD protein